MKTLTFLQTLVLVAAAAIFPTQAVELVKAKQTVDNGALKHQATQMVHINIQQIRVLDDIKENVKADVKALALTAKASLDKEALATQLLNNDVNSEIARLAE